MKKKLYFYTTMIFSLVIICITEIFYVNNVGATIHHNIARINTIRKEKIKRNVFTSEEDEALKELVKKYGTSNWKRISEQIQGRDARQCRDRWQHYLSPKINNDPWTQKEDESLMEKYEEFGNKWSLITDNYFPNRTCVQVRNRCLLLHRKKDRTNRPMYQQSALSCSHLIPEQSTIMENQEITNRQQILSHTFNNYYFYNNNQLPVLQHPHLEPTPIYYCPLPQGIVRHQNEDSREKNDPKTNIQKIQKKKSSKNDSKKGIDSTLIIDSIFDDKFFDLPEFDDFY